MRSLLLAKKQIHDPAPSDVLARLPAVVQDVGVVAAGVFEGVGEDGQAIEGTFVVDGLSQGGDVAGEPRLFDSHGTEWIGAV